MEPSSSRSLASINGVHEGCGRLPAAITARLSGSVKPASWQSPINAPDGLVHCPRKPAFRKCLHVRFGPGWWAHLVGALRAYPHKHYANYPPKTVGGPVQFAPVWSGTPISGSLAVSQGRERPLRAVATIVGSTETPLLEQRASGPRHCRFH